MTASWSEIFPSLPITGETAATVAIVANDWRSDEDWAAFKEACRLAALERGDGLVNPNRVRWYLTNEHGLVVAPRRLSAFWARATAKNGFMDNTSEWVVNDDHKGGNAGKPIRLRRLRSP